MELLYLFCTTQRIICSRSGKFKKRKDTKKNKFYKIVILILTLSKNEVVGIKRRKSSNFFPSNCEQTDDP